MIIYSKGHARINVTIILILSSIVNILLSLALISMYHNWRLRIENVLSTCMSLLYCEIKKTQLSEYFENVIVTRQKRLLSTRKINCKWH